MSVSFFDPFEIRGTALANRIVAAPLATRSFTREGQPTEKTTTMYRNYAASGAGLVVVEHHAVHPWGRNRHEQPRLYSDEDAAALKPITDLFKASGIPVVAQINFAGSMAADETLPEEDDFEYLSPSGIKTPRDSLAAKPRTLERGQIEEIVEAFAQAAIRAVKIAGYDGVQIHAAHGYLLGQFLSPLTNHRDDAYGGSAKKRARLLFEVTDAVRSSVPDVLLSVRLGVADHMPDEPLKGLSVDDTAPVARELAELGADWIGLSGNHCGFGEKLTADFPYFAPYARIVHDALRGAIPLDCAGGIRSAKTANEMLGGGICDLACIGRPFWSDPKFIEAWKR